jgi:parafibromin
MSTPISNEDEIRSTLLQWTQQGQLSNVVVAVDGSSLTLSHADAGTTTTLTNIPISISSSNSNDNPGDIKSCQYTLVSLYLQIRDADQKVMDYRNACKQYNVSDPVKTLDKALVVSYFLGSTDSTSAPMDMEDAAPENAAATTEKSVSLAVDDDTALADSQQRLDAHRKHKEDRKREKERHARDKHARDKHHKHKSRRDKPSHEAAAKKKPKLVTNEELFSNLNVVVDKRQVGATTSIVTLDANDDDALTRALSADGFVVTPELLEASRDATRRIVSHEIPMGNSASILRAANPRRNLSRVLELFNEAWNPASAHNKRGGRPRPPPPPMPGTGPKTYLMGKKPVIVVPKSMTAPLTLMNAHAFFAQAQFVPRQVSIQQLGPQRTPLTTFTRTIGGMPLEYEIVDNPTTKLGPNPKEWERIVAVVVLGQSWQFKDWLGKYSDPTFLFAHSFGFFVRMEGDKIPPDIPQWAVKQAQLNRDKRSLDSVTFAHFWNGLDEWMSVHKRELLPQNPH